MDDHAIFRSGLKADLSESIQVVGEAATVEQAIAVIAQERPEVVLLDVHLPGGLGGGGREVIAGSASLLATTKFLALSVSDAAEDVVSVIRAGARGYVTKTISGPRSPTPCSESPAETLCSRPGWPASYWTPSAPLRPILPATSWTGFPPASSK
ncbi:nitrate/nitrite response regulator protein homolog [Arthrobacter sp. Hiyo4]|nr:nitrate/nitrite response regulator protein homolog [Arthrobacter sp. Hiyo4]